jgi:hypothetical protein
MNEELQRIDLNDYGQTGEGGTSSSRLTLGWTIRQRSANTPGGSFPTMPSDCPIC